MKLSIGRDGLKRPCISLTLRLPGRRKLFLLAAWGWHKFVWTGTSEGDRFLDVGPFRVEYFAPGWRG